MSFAETLFPSYIWSSGMSREKADANGWLIHRVFAQLVLVLTVIVVLWVHIVRVSAVSLRANRASWLVDPVVDARVTYALAATVVEPPVARGAHALAGRLTFVPGSALCHKRDRAVHRHYVRLQRMQLLVRGFCQPKKISLTPRDVFNQHHSRLDEFNRRIFNRVSLPMLISLLNLRHVFHEEINFFHVTLVSSRLIILHAIIRG